MRILFNTAAALEGTSGFTQTIELLGALSRVAPEHQVLALTTRGQARLREGLPSAEHVIVDAPPGGMARTVALWRALPGLTANTGAGALYNRGNFYAPRIRCAQICLIENANPFSRLTLPQPIGSRVRNALLRRMSEAALEHATAVVFPSETARRGVIDGRTVRARAFVIRHGAEMPPGTESARPMADPYILSVTSLFPFKNLALGIDAFAQLRAAGRFNGHFVIVGDSGPEAYVRELHQKIASLGLERFVHIRPAISRAGLTPWYRHAAATITTSLEETFGLPVVEAMGLGAPVVAPHDPGPRYFVPFGELCGDAAEYFDPFDAASCAAAMQRAIEEPRRSALIASGLVRAREFTWDAAARRTAAMLSEIAASRSYSGSAPSGTTGTAL